MIYRLGGAEDFCCYNWALKWSPLKHTVWFWSPHIGNGRFHDPRLSLLLSQPPQKASVTICKQVTSILIVTSHMNLEQQLRIFGHLIWTENCLWRVTLPIQIIVIVALDLLTVEFFLIFFILRFPVTFIFDTLRFVCVHRLFEALIGEKI